MKQYQFQLSVKANGPLFVITNLNYWTHVSVNQGDDEFEVLDATQRNWLNKTFGDISKASVGKQLAVGGVSGWWEFAPSSYCTSSLIAIT